MSFTDLTASRPPEGTLERSAWDYVTTVKLVEKLAPPARARSLEVDAPVRRLREPGRPPELRTTDRGLRTRNATASALRSPERRAHLFHTFLHHELQAAELMCWAILAFPEAPPNFRRGLMAIAREEVRHMRLYAGHLERLGFGIGAFPVRDWFWERIPSATTPAAFVATMGLGFEGGNLDHSARFAHRLELAGDPLAADLQRSVGADEEGHVRFALRWFRRFTGRDGFDDWVAALPPPLSPLVMRGAPIARDARLRAGLSPTFLDQLDRWQPS
ncbi:MAG: DUF455 family protein [Deltaproteobacteria bacterium]|nr:DUF455 family protein [Deltaproteobacteria bacterium]